MSPEVLKFLELSINGLNTGMLYGLIAIGYTMVYGIIQLINFAHGEVCMLGAMFTFTLGVAFLDPSAQHVPTLAFALFVTIAALADGGFGIVLDTVAYRPLRGNSSFSRTEVILIGVVLLVAASAYYAVSTGGVGPSIFVYVSIGYVVLVGIGWVAQRAASVAFKGSGRSSGSPTGSRLSALITAIGMSLLLQNLTVIIWRAGAKTVKTPEWFSSPVFQIGSGRLSVKIQAFDLGIWVITLASMGALFFLVRRTRFGMAMRAVAQNPTAASLMGIRLDRIVATTFFIGSVLGAVGGIAVAIKKGSFDYQIGLYVGVVAFAAAVLGGIGSIPGAMLGGLIIGVAEAWAAGYLSEITHPMKPVAEALGAAKPPTTISTGYKEAVGFLVLILIILLRPQGLLGSRGGDRA